jgi:hypothetical protein
MVHDGATAFYSVEASNGALRRGTLFKFVVP